MKFLCLILYSIFSRIKILIVTKENVPAYDKVKKL